MNRTIEFDLSRAGLAKAIREFDAFSTEFKKRLNELLNLLVSTGVQIATVQISALGAVDTGELSDSISGYYSEREHVGVVYSKAPYAIYVEYGTGVIGASAPHPNITEFPPPPSEYTGYDTNGHGEDGWVYQSDRDGKLHWTRGMISRPFMYTAYKELERRMANIAHQVFGR